MQMQSYLHDCVPTLVIMGIWQVRPQKVCTYKLGRVIQLLQIQHQKDWSMHPPERPNQKGQITDHKVSQTWGQKCGWSSRDIF